MEIEAKFIVPDLRRFRQLAALSRIDAFSLGPAETLRMLDTFFDTPAHDLAAVRNVLRIRRRSDGKTLITFKTPATRQGAIHQRPETEVAVQWTNTPRVLTARALPPRIRILVEPLAQTQPLRPLFSISQTRQIRRVLSNRRTIAEWSLDRVTLRAGARQAHSYELEIELKNRGTQAELEKIVGTLSEEFHLEPQPKSKFQRALEFTGQAFS